MYKYCRDFDSKKCPSQCFISYSYQPKGFLEYEKRYCARVGKYIVETTDSFTAKVMEAIDNAIKT